MKVTIKFNKQENVRQLQCLIDALYMELQDDARLKSTESYCTIEGTIRLDRIEYAIPVINLIEHYACQCEYRLGDNYRSYKGGKALIKD